MPRCAPPTLALVRALLHVAICFKKVDRAAGEEGTSISTPYSDGGHDGPQTADLRQSNTAPAHGGEAKKDVGGHEDGSHEALLKSIANPTVGQVCMRFVCGVL